MKSRRKDVSEDRLVKPRRRYKEPSKFERVYSVSIPIDLVIEILSRLPAKSIAKCRCVSKLWASILRRPDFTELFLTRSQSRPQLLFTCHKHEIGELLFFSSPQPQFSNGNSSLATASYRMKIPFNSQHERIWHFNGLVFLKDERILEGRKKRVMVSIICNPSTRQSLVLSKMKTRKKNGLYSYFGYDPIEKQFKVLFIAATLCFGADNVSSQEFQVLTLGTKKMSWRKVECCTPHFPTFNVICINGVLYYQADVSGVTVIVCFDIRYEKFCFLEVSKNITGTRATLINYNGKLGSLVSDDGLCFSGSSKSFVLWILEDSETHEWSKRVHVLPPLWKDVVGDFSVLDVVGMVGGNELVFSPYLHYLPFCVYYYNIERNTIRRVEIQGMEWSQGKIVQTFLNHVEDIKPIDGY